MPNSPFSAGKYGKGPEINFVGVSGNEGKEMSYSKDTGHMPNTIRVTYGKGTPTERFRDYPEQVYRTLVAVATKNDAIIRKGNIRDIISGDNMVCADAGIMVEAEVL